MSHSTGMPTSVFSNLENNINWLDRDTYWLSTIPQGTPLWDGCRKYRLTGSNFGIAAGHSKFKTPSQLADEIAGITKPEIPAYNRELMAYGTSREPIARKWYEQRYGVTVKEVGLAVWKQNPYLGCSSDGIVMSESPQSHGMSDVAESDLLLEIKSVKKMYEPVKKYMQAIHEGFQPPPFYHDHMWTTHYDQIQGNLAIMNKKWCDYVVYCEPESSVFTYRVVYNPHYWEHELYPALHGFIENELKPRIQNRE